jgi:hypothetical protein
VDRGVGSRSYGSSNSLDDVGGMDFLEDLARQLYQRRHEAVVVPFRDCCGEAFRPAEQDCHRNVDVWCESHPSHVAVRGWVVFELYTPLGCEIAIATGDAPRIDL